MPEIENLNSEYTKVLLERFKHRKSFTVVEISDIISEISMVLKVDHEKGREKINNISYGHLGDLLQIGKGAVSQYMTVHNSPEYLRMAFMDRDISLSDAYYIARIKGNSDKETEVLQLAEIKKRCTGGSKRDLLTHKTQAAQSFLNTISASKHVPSSTFLPLPSGALASAKVVQENIHRCITAISPGISKLPKLRQQLEFCEIMKAQGHSNCLCGGHLDNVYLEKQITFIKDEIQDIECEQRQPWITSLSNVESDLSMAIKQIEK